MRGVCMAAGGMRAAGGACVAAGGVCMDARGMRGCQGACVDAGGACVVAGGRAWMLGGMPCDTHAPPLWTDRHL